MLTRFGFALFVCLSVSPLAVAQTVRFETNFGSFDLVLNPTANPNLQAHTDNLLAYVNSGRYDGMVINRADDADPDDVTDDFVVQMGGFVVDSLELPESTAAFTAVEAFDAVIVDADNDGEIDFDVTGLTNSRGTVSLALNAAGANSGTSSFFVNLGDNTTSLDPQDFIPFAFVPDMSTINLIMGLEQLDLDGGLTFGNIPITDLNKLVVVSQAVVIDPNPAMPLSQLSGLPLATEEEGSAAFTSEGPAVPEPSAGMLALLALAGWLATGARGRRI